MRTNYLVKAANILEKVVAILILIAVAASVIVYSMQSIHILMNGSFQLEAFMEMMLTLIVGIEFARMLILHTSQSLIEVLLYAVARQVIIFHERAIDNLIGVLAIACIFMIQKFLLTTNENTNTFKKNKAGGNQDE